jgi:signal transduction histidine kinase/CheY-like chemotaxis protein/HPt (histidine-containing phosphotransfer) domain-containing protein
MREETREESREEAREEILALKAEMESQRRENRKLARDLKNLKDLVERAKEMARASTRLSQVISAERSNYEIFFKLIMKNSSNIIIVFDQDCKFLYCSDSFLRRLNVSDIGVVAGRRLEDIFQKFLDGEDLRQCVGVFEAVLASKQSSSFEQTIEWEPGDRGLSYIINLNAMLDAGGQTLGVLVLFYDLSDKVQARQAEAASQAKSAFLATVSHELRTPLNAIIGLSEVELRERLSDRTRENLEKILNSGLNLLAIVNDILDISKIEAGGLELVPADFDVPTLINDVVQLNIVRIGSKNIVFALNINAMMPVKLHGDELRLKQVLNNLLSNAFKYTAKGRVSLHVHSRREGGEVLVRFAVADTGVGIKKEDIGKLFREYSQLKSRPDHNVEGTGLGLSITKHLVEMMNGEIEVKSRYGRGSLFIVKFRLKIVDDTPIGPETAENLRRFRLMENRLIGHRSIVRAYMPHGRVLVVDDVVTNLDVAKGLMMPYGLKIDCVLSGREAIDIVQAIPDDAPCSEKYHIIFMDHMMPGMDGVEATRVIRGEIGTEYARTVPIIALTANALSGSNEMFLKNGFDGFISKPIDIFRLDAVLNRWVNGGQDAGALWGPEEEKKGAAPRDEVLRRSAGGRADGIDLDAGVLRYGGRGPYLKILQSYVQHTPKLLEKLSAGSAESLSPEEAQAYIIAVHGLKGSSYGICANAVAGRAEELESAARAGEWEKVRSGSDFFIGEVKALLARLGEFLKSAAEGVSGERKEKPRRAAPDRVILEQLLSAARRFQISRMEDLLTELESFDYDSGGNLVAWLRAQTDDIEYDAVSKHLEELLGEISICDR